MVIEVFYVPGCPNHQPAIESLKNVLRSATIDALIQEIAVADQATAGRRCSFRVLPQYALMAATWNRITGSPTALRADSIRTELGFHLVKSWSRRLRKQRSERSERWVQPIQLET